MKSAARRRRAILDMHRRPVLRATRADGLRVPAFQWPWSFGNLARPGLNDAIFRHRMNGAELYLLSLRIKVQLGALRVGVVPIG